MCNKCKCCCQGLRGPQGPQGPEGPQGPSGVEEQAFFQAFLEEFVAYPVSAETRNIQFRTISINDIFQRGGFTVTSSSAINPFDTINFPSIGVYEVNLKFEYGIVFLITPTPTDPIPYMLSISTQTTPSILNTPSIQADALVPAIGAGVLRQPMNVNFYLNVTELSFILQLSIDLFVFNGIDSEISIGSLVMNINKISDEPVV